MSRLMSLALRGSDHPEKYSATYMKAGPTAPPVIAPPVAAAPAMARGPFDPKKHPRGGIPENKGEFSSTPGSGSASPPPAVGKSAASNPGIANSGVDPAARHAFTKTQLGSVHEPLRGLMGAFHADPAALSSGSTLTQAVAPNLARQSYAWLRQNVGKLGGQNTAGASGASQAVDLGQGRLGYASPAGSIIVWPADSSGKHQIKFTNQTGVVSRAMGSPAPAGQPGQRPAAPQTGGQPQSMANPVPHPSIVPPPVIQPGQSLNTPASHSPFGPTPPPVTAAPPPQPGFEPPKATPQQLQSASALTEKPQPKARPGGPQTPREIAEGTKQELARATAQWQQELAGGLSTKGNARWRSYLAALNSIHGHQDKLAREHERQQAQRAQAKGSGAAASGQPPLSDHESAAVKAAPDAFKELQGMRESMGESAYQDAVKQLAKNRKPWEGRMLGGFEGAQVEQPPEKRPQVPSGALPPDERGAMARMGIDPATGKPIGRNSPPEGPQWRHAGEAFSKPTEEHKSEALRRLSAEGPDELHVNAGKYLLSTVPHEYDQWKANQQAEFKRQQAGGKPSPEFAKAHYQDLVNRAVGHLSRELAKEKRPSSKAEREAAMRASARAGFETPPQKQPEPIDGSSQYKALVKQKASEWDMKPDDFHSLASDLHKELTEHLGQQEAAKQHARKSLNLHAGDINRLENQGLDYGSNHPRIKQLDTIGRELAAHYPGLGWGRGREDEGNDEGNIDYAEKVWNLIKEGAKSVPSITSPEFMDHVEEYLSSQLKRHGSSGTQGGHTAESEDLSAVPFTQARDGLVERYRQYLADSSY